MIHSILTTLTALLVGLGPVIPTSHGPPLALPHVEGEDYVFLDFHHDEIVGRFEINLDDLRDKLGLEVERNAETAAADAARVAPSVQAYIRENFSIGPQGGAPYALQFTEIGIFTLPKRSYAQYHFQIAIEALPQRLTVRHSMFYESDRRHRGLLCVEYNARTDTTYPEEYTALVFGPDKREQTLDLDLIPSIIPGPREMIPHGIFQVWTGIDQALFLLALLLSTVLVLRESWQPVDGRTALWNLAKVVFVFGFAHSVALLLAALDLITLPPPLVGAVVALSVVLVALNNITGKVREGTLWIVFVLGVFHGLELAAEMGNLPFRVGQLLKSVIGFNIGVELGLLAVIVLVFPILYRLRRSRLYQPVVLKATSAVLALLAVGLFVQRALASS